jgi:predicted Abi (CAAX) family protease
MANEALSRFWELVGWVFALNPEAFRVVSSLRGGFTVALLIVLLAGLSQAIAQSIILFVNRVKPGRFLFSLGINAVLFAAGFLFLVFSTWLLTLLPGTVNITFRNLATVTGIAFAPLLFSFLGALPYLGGPILSVLSVWNLLAIVVGIIAVTGLKANIAFSYVILGWFVLQILQQTVGRPIASLGSRLANTVAGVKLVRQRGELTAMVSDRATSASSTWQEEFRERITEVRQQELQSPLPDQPSGYVGSRPAITQTSPPSLTQSAESQLSETRQVNRTLKTLLGLVGMGAATFLVVALLEPLREWWFGWYDSLPWVLRRTFDLVWIGVIAFTVAGLLAPLETLGWWAGWYDDDLDTTVNVGELAVSGSGAIATSQPQPQQISRYIVYLDGIGKSTFEYLPDIEEFLNTLVPTLPPDVALIRGIMPYSVINNPLDEDRPLAFLWKLADKARFANPSSLLGLLVNFRNVMIVGVSADKRYGPLYNQGIAQIVYNGLIKNGYPVNSGIPITLIGYSGGGQMSCACAPFLKRALSAPIDVISLGGVISGNCNVLQLEHLYHLVGDKDDVERIGPIMFPGRWKFTILSYWNRAKRRGKITFLSLGALGHQVPGGILDPQVILPDGRSALQQTIDYIHRILRGELLPAAERETVKLSNYDLYRQLAWNQPDYYPLDQIVPSDRYRAIAPWMGRLILPQPAQRKAVQGALMEVHHAPPEHQHLVGRLVALRWVENPRLQRLVQAVTKDVHFSAEAEYTSQYGGLVHPDRLNHWLQVNPLESLAGSHPVDDMTVKLEDPVQVESAEPELTPLAAAVLRIPAQPMQITGRYYGLVKFVQPVGDDRYQVVHFNRASRQFDGASEIVALPPVAADENGCYPSTSNALEASPLNELGWYIYGAPDAMGTFVVQSLGPRSLFRLQPDRVLFSKKSAYQYIRKESWADIVAQKGRIASVLCTPQNRHTDDGIQRAIAEWTDPDPEMYPVGTRALLLHVYGGIGGNKREPAAATPIFFGHFACGMAQVIHDPLADEPRFDLSYYQVYTHNADGLIAGTLHWSRYMGDRQFGWAGVRPTCDILIKLDAFTGFYTFDLGNVQRQRSPFDGTQDQLVAMTARYRIGDGTGGTYVGPANNCAQDSNQAIFVSIQQLSRDLQANAAFLETWAQENPDQARRMKQLAKLGRDLKGELQPFGNPRRDWDKNEFNLGSTIEDEPLRNLLNGIASWRTLLPRKASDTVVKIFLNYGASVWVLRTNQIGGHDPDIEPIAPITL